MASLLPPRKCSLPPILSYPLLKTTPFLLSKGNYSPVFKYVLVLPDFELYMEGIKHYIFLCVWLLGTTFWGAVVHFYFYGAPMYGYILIDAFIPMLMNFQAASCLGLLQTELLFTFFLVLIKAFLLGIYLGVKLPLFQNICTNFHSQHEFMKVPKFILLNVYIMFYCKNIFTVSQWWEF